MLKINDEGVEAKILTASMFWVNASNDLVNSLERTFKERIAISIKSMDSNLKDEPVESAA